MAAENAPGQSILFEKPLTTEGLSIRVTSSVPDAAAMREMFPQVPDLSADVRRIEFQLLKAGAEEPVTVFSQLHRPQYPGFGVPGGYLVLDALKHQESIYVAVSAHGGLAVVVIGGNGMVSTDWLRGWNAVSAVIPFDRSMLEASFVRMDGGQLCLDIADLRGKDRDSIYRTRFRRERGEFVFVLHRRTDKSGRTIETWGAELDPPSITMQSRPATRPAPKGTPAPLGPLFEP